MHWIGAHRIAVFGSIGVLILSSLFYLSYVAHLQRVVKDRSEQFRRRNGFKTVLFVTVGLVIVVLWARLLQHTGTFLGILGAGLAVALREPLLSIAGRIAILSGHMFNIGDRIEVNKMSGDVIDVGFFYTRMMEIGNWISADQATGRIVQISNSSIFGAPIFNYTQAFSYIWDELKIPITYDSNVDRASKILVEVGAEYTKEFLTGAEKEMEEMRRSYLVPEIELKPTVFLKVTDNWLELCLRYVVDPKKRRVASDFMFRQIFQRVKALDDISIASETMDLTVQPKKAA